MILLLLSVFLVVNSYLHQVEENQKFDCSFGSFFEKDFTTSIIFNSSTEAYFEEDFTVNLDNHSFVSSLASTSMEVSEPVQAFTFSDDFIFVATDDGINSHIYSYKKFGRKFLSKYKRFGRIRSILAWRNTLLFQEMNTGSFIGDIKQLKFGASDFEDHYPIGNACNNIPTFNHFGFEILIKGDVAFFAVGNKVLYVDIDSESTEITLNLKYFELEDTVYGVALKEDYAFVAAGTFGMAVFDTEDETVNNMLASFQGIENPDFRRIKVRGDYAFIACKNNGLLIVDISDPLNPFLAKQFEAPGAKYLAIRHNYIYISVQTNILMIDITNPKFPKLLKTILMNSPGQIIIANNTLYVTEENTVSVIDTSTITISGPCDTYGIHTFTLEAFNEDNDREQYQFTLNVNCPNLVCENGGTPKSDCSACDCINDYYGDTCNLWDCSSVVYTDYANVCSGKGDCVSPNNCSCSDFYIGDNCDSQNCPEGFFGDGCLEFTCGGIASDADNVCSNNGKCSSFNTCECNEGFSGETCAEFTCDGISNTDANVCNGHGTCLSPNVCDCEDENYLGDYCETWSCNDLLNSDASACGGQGFGTCVGHDTCECVSSPFIQLVDGSCEEFSTGFVITAAIGGSLLSIMVVLVVLALGGLFVCIWYKKKAKNENMNIENTIEAVTAV